MNNISQGLFTFNFDMTINPEYSTCSNNVLCFDDIAKYTLPQLLRMSQVDEEAMAEWITLVRDKYRIHRWPKLERLAPVQEMKIPGEGGEAKYIKIDYEKILDKQNNLTKIMVLAQDVTESRRIQRKQIRK